MQGKRWIVCTFTVAILLGLQISVFAKLAPGAQPYNIEIYAGSVGTANYVMCFALSEIINKHSTWLRSTTIEAEQPDVNVKMLAQKPEKRKNALVFGNPDSLWTAKRGLGVFAGTSYDYNRIRLVALLGYTTLGLVSLNPNIKTVKDLAGKRVSIGPKGAVSQVLAFESIFKLQGCLNKVRCEYMRFEAGGDSLRDGLIDATFASVTLKALPNIYLPAPWTAMLIATKKIQFISFNEADIRATVTKEIPGLPYDVAEVPAKMLDSQQNEPWISLGKYLTWAADLEMPNDVVDEICRVIWENAGKFKDYLPAAAMLTKNTMATMGTTSEEDVHPGALKFYKEKGIKLGNFGF